MESPPDNGVQSHLISIAGIVAAITGIVTGFKVVWKAYKANKAKFMTLLDLPESVRVQQEEVLALVKANQEELVIKINSIDALGMVTRNYLDIPFYECDENGFCTYASNRLSQIFGMEASSMLGRGWLAGIESDDSRDRAWAEWAASVENHIPYNSSYVVKSLSSGDRTFYRTTTVPVKDNAGNTIKYIGYITDAKTLQRDH